MRSPLFMGIDIGTSGIRAALFDERGMEVSICHNEYPAIADRPGQLEIDPELIFNTMIEVVRSSVRGFDMQKHEIAGAGMSSQMHSLLAVDREWRPLTNLLTWADTRAKEEAGFIERENSLGDLYMRTGCRVQHPMYPLGKILWLKNNEGEIFERVNKFVTIKEYIFHRLYGVDVIDISDASTTGYFNIHNHDWDEDIIYGLLGLGRERFGEPVPGTYVLRSMKSEYAEAMGIDRDTPFVPGAGDGILANVGCGVVDDTSMSSTIGTSGALRIATDSPLLDPYQRTWCYCFTKERWVAGGAISNGGIVLRWLRDQWRRGFELEAEVESAGSVYELFSRYAEEIPPGSEGLIFLPYLNGERSPDWNADARASITGLTLSHSKKHIIRAAMEGVIYRMYSVYKAMGDIYRNVKDIRCNGGYVKSDVWLQIQADIFDKDLMVAGAGEASVLGAAFMSMVAVGAVGSFDERLPAMEPTRVVKPREGMHEIYESLYRKSMEIYDKLK